MRVGDTILAASPEANIDENGCLVDNQLICNAFINNKYLLNIRYDTDGKYLQVHCNIGMAYTNNIVALPG